MKLRRFLSLLTATGVVAATAVVAAPVVPRSEAADPVRLLPNPAYAGQPFEGWGTSLVWFANATGGYPPEVRQELFDAVFGAEGLNLNIARYNIGGGNAVDVPPYLRAGGAVDGWWNPELAAEDADGPITATYADRDRYAAAWDGDDPASYDFEADATQRWWIDALRDEGVTWEAFSNSPPYFLTESGYVSGGINNATSEQLAPENMEAFADYLVTVVEHIEQEQGIDFGSLDPFNEPNTNYWSTRIGANGWPTNASRQEGAHIGPQAQDQMIKVLAARLAEEETTTDVPISAMDETNPTLFATNWNGYSAESKGLVDQLNVHTYGTNDRTVVRDIAKSSDKPLWMSEVEGNWDNSGFNQVNIESGLGIADRIVDDLRELEPTAWVFWQPVEDLYNMEKVEKLNWGSVYIDFDCDADGNSARRLADGDADPSCKVLTNAKYNTARNFTHYIRPGDQLIPSGNDQTTAAISPEDSTATLVHINTEASARTVTVDLSQFGAIAPGATVTPIVTTQSPADAVEQNALVEGVPVAVNAATRSATLEVPAKSVTTLVVSGVSGTAADATAFADGSEIQLIGAASGKALSADPTDLAIRTGATTGDAAIRQAWTVHSLSGAGTNRQSIALQAGDGRWLATAAGGTALRTATLEEARADRSLQWIPSTTDGTRWSLLSPTAEQVLDVNGQSTADGARVGLYRSNNGGNQLWTIAEIIPPTTAQASVTSADAPSAAGWYQQSVLVRMTAPVAGQKVQYRINGGVWRTYTSAVTVSANGITTIDHRLLVSNVVVPGSEASTQVKIDKQAPTVAAERSPASGTGSPRNPIELALSGSDALSGLSRVEYRINSGGWVAATGPVTVGEVGDYVISYRAVDEAGNTSATKSLTVVIVEDPATTLRADARTARPGDAVTFSLTGFSRWDDVSISAGQTVIGTVLTDRNGAARVTVRIPAGTPAGSTVITATGTGGTISVTVGLTIR